MISASVTAMKAPWLSPWAFRAFSLFTGLPMRMAVAIVSGCSTVWPSTIGAAPAAWKPIMRGRVRLRPAALYSLKPIQ